METYTALKISMAHITSDDNSLLHSITHRHPHALKHHFYGMVMDRYEGYFMKLYDERYLNEDIPDISEALQKIILYTHDEGHRLIEFDCDAPSYPELFKVFSW